MALALQHSPCRDPGRAAGTSAEHRRPAARAQGAGRRLTATPCKQDRNPAHLVPAEAGAEGTGRGPPTHCHGVLLSEAGFGRP